jgi:hypothetical protein
MSVCSEEQTCDFDDTKPQGVRQVEISRVKLAGAKWSERKANGQELRAALQRRHLSFRFLPGNEIGSAFFQISSNCW